MSGGAGEVGAAVAAGGENAHVRAEAVQLAFGKIEGNDAAALVALHDEIDHEVFDEESRAMADRLLIERVQHRMPGAVRRGAGALRDAFAVVRRHAADWTLINAPSCRARKRHPVMFELN